MGHIILAFTAYLAIICLNSTKDDFLYIRHSYSPVENLTPAASWWARLVSIQLLQKETDLQSAAFADSLLTLLTTLYYFVLMFEKLPFKVNGAGSEARTRTKVSFHWILSPRCLPIPPYPHIAEQL